MRRLPIFFVLDVSESMVGEPLRRLQDGLEQIISGLRRDPHALETAHIGVIAFAGQARSLVPLVEVANFYPPRLPIGGGTALGAALEVLMSELDRQVQPTTRERKGDWKPVIYLITDGRPTDNPSAAIRRWREQYAQRAQLIAIALSPDADLKRLSELTEQVLLYNERTAEDFLDFIRWVTASLRTQSQAIDLGLGNAGVSLAKLDDNPALSLVQSLEQMQLVDPRCVVLTGRCQKHHLPYLMKYDQVGMVLHFEGFSLDKPMYRIAGCYPLDESYFQWSDPHAPSEPISTSQLEGAPGCPHCGNPFAFAQCRCGRLLCVSGPGEAVCPWCGNQCNFGEGDGNSEFEVQRGQG